LPYFLLDPRVRRGLLLLWGALWLWVAYMSLTPVQLPPGVSDKSLHFTGYALMSAGAVGFCHEPRRLGLLALLAAAVGGALEIAQAFTPDRSPELLDFAADSAGAALGWLLALAWLALVVRPLRRRPAPA
jgi:VanZ family protein